MYEPFFTTQLSKYRPLNNEAAFVFFDFIRTIDCFLHQLNLKYAMQSFLNHIQFQLFTLSSSSETA